MSKFKLAATNVEIGDGVSVSVRGLSFGDIEQILATHKPVVESLFDRFNGRDPDSIQSAEVGKLALELISTVPGFVAQMIALGADAIDEYDEVVKLPLGTQIALIEAIGGLTFKDAASAKKTWQIVSATFFERKSSVQAA
jgi:hypothetical protein